MNKFDRPLPKLTEMLRAAEHNLNKEKGNAIMMVREGNGKKQYKSGDMGKGKGKNKFKPNTFGLKPTSGVAKNGSYFHCGETRY